MAFDSLGQSLSMSQVVEGKRDDGRQPGVGCGDPAGQIIVVASQMDVAIDRPWQDVGQK